MVFLLNKLRTDDRVVHGASAADKGIYAASAADRGIYTAAAAADRGIYAAVAAAAAILYYILKTNNPFFVLGFRRIRSRSFHAMGTSVYQCDCRTYRQWKIDVCPTVRSQYQTHDDSQARSDLMVLW